MFRYNRNLIILRYFVELLFSENETHKVCVRDCKSHRLAGTKHFWNYYSRPSRVGNSSVTGTKNKAYCTYIVKQKTCKL